MATIEAGDRVILREPKEGHEVVCMDYKHKQVIVKSHIAGIYRHVPFSQILSVKKTKREMCEDV